MMHEVPWKKERKSSINERKIKIRDRVRKKKKKERKTQLFFFCANVIWSMHWQAVHVFDLFVVSLNPNNSTMAFHIPSGLHIRFAFFGTQLHDIRISDPAIGAQRESACITQEPLSHHVHRLMDAR